jgi:hypothetical protein
MRKKFEGSLKLRLLRTSKKTPKFQIRINDENVEVPEPNEDIVVIPCIFPLGDNIIDVEFINKEPADTVVADDKIVEDLAIQIEEFFVDGIDMSHNFKVASRYTDSPMHNSYGFMYKNGVLSFQFICPVFLYIRNLALVKDEPKEVT